MIKINARISFNKKEKCLICENMTKVVYHVDERNASFCGNCFGKLYYKDAVIINKDYAEDYEFTSKTDKYLKEHLEARLRTTNDILTSYKAFRLWINKEERSAEDTRNYMEGLMENYVSTINDLEKELEGK